jgi:hypothetical protein
VADFVGWARGMSRSWRQASASRSTPPSFASSLRTPPRLTSRSPGACRRASWYRGLRSRRAPILRCAAGRAGAQPVGWSGAFPSDQVVSDMTLRAGDAVEIDLRGSRPVATSGTLARPASVYGRYFPPGTRIRRFGGDFFAQCTGGHGASYLGGAWRVDACGTAQPAEPRATALGAVAVTQTGRTG